MRGRAIPAPHAADGPAVSVDIIRATGEVNVITAADGDIYKLDPISFRCGPSGKNGCP